MAKRAYRDGDRRRWVKLYADFYTSPSHMDLGHYARLIGPILMVLADGSDWRTGEGWICPELSREVFVKRVASLAKVYAKCVESGLKDLESAGTVEEKCGHFRFCNYAKFQSKNSLEEEEEEEAEKKKKPIVESTKPSVSKSGVSETFALKSSGAPGLPEKVADWLTDARRRGGIRAPTVKLNKARRALINRVRTDYGRGWSDEMWRDAIDAQLASLRRSAPDKLSQWLTIETIARPRNFGRILESSSSAGNSGDPLPPGTVDENGYTIL